jgi:hypothetical protein
MSNQSSTPNQVISLPKGGGALQGLGEKFSPDLHTGTGNFTFSTTPIIVKVAGVVPVKVDIADLDKDGLPEVVFSDQGDNVEALELTDLRPWNLFHRC